jgi:hypothetical protein
LSTQSSKVFEREIEMNEDEKNHEKILNPNYVDSNCSNDIHLEKSQIFKFVNKKHNILEEPDHKLIILSGFNDENVKNDLIKSNSPLHSNFRYSLFGRENYKFCH